MRGQVSKTGWFSLDDKLPLPIVGTLTGEEALTYVSTSRVIRLPRKRLPANNVNNRWRRN
jgi:hypothetical protein